MTCIAALVHDGTSYIAGDRGATDGDTTLTLLHPKVWGSGEYLFGYHGTMFGEIVQENFSPPKVTGSTYVFMRTVFKKALKDFYSEWNIDDDEFGMVICVRGKIFEHNKSDMSMTSFDLPYLACGSGGSYAMGSLHSTQHYKNAEKRLSMALDAAIEFSNTCQGPVDILSL